MNHRTPLTMRSIAWKTVGRRARLFPLWLPLALLAVIGCDAVQTPVVDLAEKRQRMVKEQLMPRGIHEQRVLAAMANVPREEFVPERVREAS